MTSAASILIALLLSSSSSSTTAHRSLPPSFVSSPARKSRVGRAIRHDASSPGLLRRLRPRDDYRSPVRGGRGGSHLPRDAGKRRRPSSASRSESCSLLVASSSSSNDGVIIDRRRRDDEDDEDDDEIERTLRRCGFASRLVTLDDGALKRRPMIAEIYEGGGWNICLILGWRPPSSSSSEDDEKSVSDDMVSRRVVGRRRTFATACAWL